MTEQRRLVLDALAGADDHVSAEEIFDRIRSEHPNVNMSTVYRTLEALEEAGIVYHSHLGHGMSQWHVELEHEGHQHLVCEECGTVQRIPLEAFLPYQRALFERYGFRADPRHFAVFGRCAGCQRAPSRAVSGSTAGS
jgi:Fur family ferric uptake transcriptional regulator